MSESKFTHWQCQFCGLENIPIFESDLQKLCAVLDELGIKYKIKKVFEALDDVYIETILPIFDKDGKRIK